MTFHAGFVRDRTFAVRERTLIERLPPASRSGELSRSIALIGFSAASRAPNRQRGGDGLDSTSLTRVISDDHRWEARWSFEHEEDSDGYLWDLVELFVHRQPALVAAIRGDEVVPRFFIPGQWERMFIDADVFDTVPKLPN